jgi:hypothetical protein
MTLEKPQILSSKPEKIIIYNLHSIIPQYNLDKVVDDVFTFSIFDMECYFQYGILIALRTDLIELCC